MFQGKVHIGYLAAIVAASNAGGSGSVVGDTTTTMMWIAGVSPLAVVEAYVAAVAAMLIFAVPASIQQQRYSPIQRTRRRGLKIDPARVFIVAAILIAALAANIIANIEVPALLDAVPVLGLAVWAVILLTRWIARTGLEGDARNLQGHHLPARAGHRGLDDAGRETAGRVMADGARPGLRLRRVRQHSLTALALKQGGYDWGFLGLCASASADR